MLKTPALERKNIFAVPCDDLGKEDGKNILLYAPLAKFAVFLESEDVFRLEQFLATASPLRGTSLPGILDKLLDQSPVPCNPVRKPSDVFALTVLPTSKCNFSCSYCYSAAGHASKELDINHLNAVLDYFIDEKRVNRDDLYISFGGGGEPFLSWDIIEHTMVYATQMAEKQGLRISFSFASNGSVINEKIIRILKKFKVKANISFDILESVHNAQRKNYDIICQTLDRLLEAEIIPSINAVITPLNVTLQEKMVEEISRRFPKIKRLSFDPVVDTRLYANPEDYHKFFSDYTEGFFKARKLGKILNVDVNCILLRNLSMLRDRACPGSFDLTPHGTISSCFFVSSPKETLYDDFIFGKVDDSGRLEFNDAVFSKNQGDSLAGKERCAACFAKWHCGGGCHYQNSSYSVEIQDVLCNNIREFTRRALVEKFDDQNC
jgi:uncharacterized protein